MEFMKRTQETGPRHLKYHVRRGVEAWLFEYGG